MRATFTEDDVGKTVEDAGGTKIGVVSSVEDGTALVEPDHDAIESIKSGPGWNLNSDETVPIGPDSVDTITDEVVRLEGGRSSSSTDEATGTRTDASDGDADEPVVEQDEDTGGPRSVGASDVPSDRRTRPDQPQVEGEAGADRHEDNEDAPPHGDRTVTKERGEDEDR
ncbi:hypothetical protein [Halopiger thermotolerans]